MYLLSLDLGTLKLTIRPSNLIGYGSIFLKHNGSLAYIVVLSSQSQNYTKIYVAVGGGWAFLKIYNNIHPPPPPPPPDQDKKHRGNGAKRLTLPLPQKIWSENSNLLGNLLR